jgi:hypothetical protein
VRKAGVPAKAATSRREDVSLRTMAAVPFLFMTVTSALAASPPPVAAQKVLDNDRVTVFDLTLKTGEQGPVTPSDEDAVILFLEGGKIRSDGSAGGDTNGRNFGDAVFVPKGSNVRDTLVEGGSAHEVVVWLKNKAAISVNNPTPYPPAWPRPGAARMLENDRVIAWRYEWQQAQPTPLHFHLRPQLAAYRGDGLIISTEADEAKTEMPHHNGEVVYSPPGHIHSEELATGALGAAVLELK